MQTFAQITHGIKWNYIYMVTDILRFFGSVTYAFARSIQKSRLITANRGNGTQPTKETKFSQLRKRNSAN